MKPVSSARSAASRANGAKSHGPVSPEGKANSARNAMRHGLSSRRILVDGESEEQLNALRVYWMRQLQPLTPAERETAEEVVAAQWRLRRCNQIEASLLSVEMKTLCLDASDPDSMAAAFKNLADNSPSLNLIHRYTTGARRDFDRALARYKEVVAQRREEHREDGLRRTDEDFITKWGAAPEQYVIGYCGKSSDLLPNEPEPAPIFDAAITHREPIAA